MKTLKKKDRSERHQISSICEPSTTLSSCFTVYDFTTEALEHAKALGEWDTKHSVERNTAMTHRAVQQGAFSGVYGSHYPDPSREMSIYVANISIFRTFSSTGPLF